jgi:hypothetical protein
MKRTHKFGWLFALFITAGSQVVTAQTASEVFNNSETPIFYLGIDFTKSKLIDDAGANAFDIRDRQYTGINEVVANEEKKYDLKGAFHKKYVDHDLGPVAKRNEKVNAEDILSSNTSDFRRLKEDDISSLVKGWDFGDRKGVGLLFVAEALNKGKKSAAYWVTLVDMKSKKVLMTERMEAPTSMAFGFRNYWASSVKNLIDNIEKKKYKEWKSRYSS